MVFVEVYSVMMLPTSETSTTGMLAVLSYTPVTGGHMAAAGEFQLARVFFNLALLSHGSTAPRPQPPYSFRRFQTLSLAS